jgi:hypothetical protein
VRGFSLRLPADEAHAQISPKAANEFASFLPRMRNFSLIRPPNHLAVYGGLGEFPKKSC